MKTREEMRGELKENKNVQHYRAAAYDDDDDVTKESEMFFYVIEFLLQTEC